MAAEIHRYSYMNERELNAHSPACSTIGLNLKKKKKKKGAGVYLKFYSHPLGSSARLNPRGLVSALPKNKYTWFYT